MKKIYTLLAVLLCITLTANAQLGVPGLTMDPGTVPKFTNDLPVIKDLGLRIDLTQGTLDPLSVKMEETTQDLLGLGIQTKVWGYRFPDLPATYPGATIVAMENIPIEIKWKNKLKGHFLPVDVSLHMAHPADLMDLNAVRDWYAAGNVPTVAHLHGGHTESASDGLPEAWFTQKNETGAYFVKKDYLYHNDQEAATLWYHDHALGITRLNVYAGLAGFYLLRDANENALIADNTLPGGDYEIEIVIQDRMFDVNGQLFWPAYPGDPAYADFITGEVAILPESDFPGGGPTALAEFFGDIILVNGKAWPKLDVEPRKYRFRLLNGSDSRFYILKLDQGVSMLVIGSDDGLLQYPVELNELVFAPGERYDVVVDFTGMENASITMENYGPDEPYGGGIPGLDFAVSDPASTGKIMQFQVTKPLNAAIPNATVTGASELNSITPLIADAGSPRQLALFEGLDEYGRLQPMLGTMDAGSLTWSQPITEYPGLGSTEIWEVYNATGDAHPIHLHLVKFQILNRQEFEGFVDDKQQPQHKAGVFGTGGILTVTDHGAVTAPLPHETGWKDTFIVPPGQVGRVVAKFDRPGRYVWHCHILSHEDHEMMRPFEVIQPVAGSLLKGLSVEQPQQAGPEEEMVEFRVYPNPAINHTIVDFQLTADADVTVRIYSYDGKIVNADHLGHMGEGVQSISVPLDHLQDGMYILELSTGSKLYRENIIITR